MDSAIDFCNLSMVLRERLAPSETVAGVAQYDTNESPFTRVTRVHKVWVAGVELQAVSAQDAFLASAPVQRPTAFFVTREGDDILVNLYPTPDAVYPLQVEVVLRPSRGATMLDDGLFDIWLEPVIEGAKARLMAIPDQPFSNPAGAKQAAQLAFTLTQKARVDGSFGRVVGGMRVAPRFFA